MPNEYAYVYMREWKGFLKVWAFQRLRLLKRVGGLMLVMKRDIIQRVMVCTVRIAAQPLTLHTGRRGRADTA